MNGYQDVLDLLLQWNGIEPTHCPYAGDVFGGGYQPPPEPSRCDCVTPVPMAERSACSKCGQALPAEFPRPQAFSPEEYEELPCSAYPLPPHASVRLATILEHAGNAANLVIKAETRRHYKAFKRRCEQREALLETLYAEYLWWIAYPEMGEVDVIEAAESLISHMVEIVACGCHHTQAVPEPDKRVLTCVHLALPRAEFAILKSIYRRPRYSDYVWDLILECTERRAKGDDSPIMDLAKDVGDCVSKRYIRDGFNTLVISIDDEKCPIYIERSDNGSPAEFYPQSIGDAS